MFSRMNTLQALLLPNTCFQVPVFKSFFAHFFLPCASFNFLFLEGVLCRDTSVLCLIVDNIIYIFSYAPLVWLCFVFFRSLTLTHTHTHTLSSPSSIFCIFFLTFSIPKRPNHAGCISCWLFHVLFLYYFQSIFTLTDVSTVVLWIWWRISCHATTFPTSTTKRSNRYC